MLRLNLGVHDVHDVHDEICVFGLAHGMVHNLITYVSCIILVWRSFRLRHFQSYPVMCPWTGEVRMRTASPTPSLLSKTYPVSLRSKPSCSSYDTPSYNPAPLFHVHITCPLLLHSLWPISLPSQGRSRGVLESDKNALGLEMRAVEIRTENQQTTIIFTDYQSSSVSAGTGIVFLEYWHNIHLNVSQCKRPHLPEAH